MRKIILINLLFLYSTSFLFAQGAEMYCQVGSTSVLLGNSIEVKVKFYWTYPNSVNNPTYSPDVYLRLYKQGESYENGDSPIAYLPNFNIPNTSSPNWNGVWYSTYVTIPANIPQGYYHIRASKSNWPGNSSVRHDYSQSFAVTAPAPTMNNPHIYSNSITNNSLNVYTLRQSFTNQYGYNFRLFTADGQTQVGWYDVVDQVNVNPVAHFSGLDAETEYCVKVRACNFIGNCTAYTTCFNFTTLPLLSNTPTNLNANVISGNKINLAWTDNNTDETFFEIERSTDANSNFALIATVNQDVTSYSDLGLDINTTYYYRVRAGNDNGHSQYSNIADGTTLPSFAYYKNIAFYQQGVTPNPTNPNNYLNQDLPIRFKVKVKNELAQNLSALTGTITSTTAGVSITNANVSFSTMLSGDQTWSTNEFEITVDPSVANGTNLEFELSCNDPLANGGPWTSSFSFPIAPLQTGTVVLVDNQGDNDGIPEPGENDIILQPKIDNISTQIFENVRGILSDANGFLNITQDNYLYNVVSSVPQPVNPGDTDIEPSLPFKFNYPTNEAFQELNFNLELQANLNNASGTLLKWQTTFTENDGVEPPPSLVSTNPTDNATDVAIDTDLTLTFNKAITAVSGKNIYLYKNNSLDQTIATTDAMVSINNEVVTINLSTDLDGGAAYYIITDVGAFIDANSLEFAGILTPTEWNFTTVQSNPPNAPVITATAISDSEIEITWSAVTDADTYNVYSCDETVIYATGLTSTNYTATGLTGETQYDFIVKAANGAGLSVASNCANDTTFCAVPWTSADIVTQGGIVTAYGIVTIDGQPVTAFDKVGAFVGTELRAIGDVAMYNGDAYTTLAIESSGTETISFKVWDQSECQLVSVTFTVDASPTDVVGLPPNYLPIAGDTTTSITDNLITTISVYPNPTNDIIYIDNKDNLKIQKITMYNLLGKQVLQVRDNTNQISTKNLTTGIYFINIQTEKGTLIKKIMKK